MKKTIFVLMALFAMNAMADRILWVGIDPDAEVHIGNDIYNLGDWIDSYSGMAGGQILLRSTALYAGFEDPNQVVDPSLIPAGQSTPTIVWETDFEGDHVGPYTDFELSVVDENYEPIPGMYADWQPILLQTGANTDPSHVELYFNIGYYDDDYNFTAVASAMNYMDAVWDPYSYESGTLAPPIQTPWRPDCFVAVPEPSTAIIALLGVGLLIKRRK